MIVPCRPVVDGSLWSWKPQRRAVLKLPDGLRLTRREEADLIHRRAVLVARMRVRGHVVVAVVVVDEGDPAARRRWSPSPALTTAVAPMVIVAVVGRATAAGAAATGPAATVARGGRAVAAPAAARRRRPPGPPDRHGRHPGASHVHDLVSNARDAARGASVELPRDVEADVPVVDAAAGHLGEGGAEGVAEVDLEAVAAEPLLDRRRRTGARPGS